MPQKASQRFVVYGAGAIGAGIGAGLQQAGYEVVLIARGEHAHVLRERGLRVESHAGVAQLRVHVAEHPRELALDAARDIVILATKTQDLDAALAELANVAPASLPVACAQNGVEAERLALRRFANVQAISVLVPAVFLEPGVVQLFVSAFTAPKPSGRYTSCASRVARHQRRTVVRRGSASNARTMSRATPRARWGSAT
jgi:2-dehydropantoate 2-reductase